MASTWCDVVAGVGHSGGCMKLIVGLGNPGSEYEKTRHNAGFMAIDRLCQRHRITDAQSKFHAWFTQGTMAGEKCLLMKPMTYMNRSGLSVGEAATFYKIEPTQILVLVDDLALPLGKIRLRGDGSSGGHNGLIDIERAMGTTSYRRLRIGIDMPNRGPGISHVLERFSGSQLEELDKVLDLTCLAVECWIQHGLAKAMSLYNAEQKD